MYKKIEKKIGLYNKFAEHWQLLSNYKEQEFKDGTKQYISILRKHDPQIKTVLEMGCGGGNNAYYLKKHFKMTLSDLSKKILKQSKKINPKCEHVQGDMRTLTLNRTFDAVFIHDAIGHILTIKDLEKVMRTAHLHCKDKGTVLIVPDFIKDIYQPSFASGGHGDHKNGLRFMDWNYDPDPKDTTCISDYMYIVRKNNRTIHTIHDHFPMGLFSKKQWSDTMKKNGFTIKFIPLTHKDVEFGRWQGILGKKK